MKFKDLIIGIQPITQMGQLNGPATQNWAYDAIISDYPDECFETEIYVKHFYLLML